MAERDLAYVDSLRVALIVLVVAHHAAQPYGPTGGAWPIAYPQQSAWLGPFFTVNAGFFMGLFFLLAGYFSGAAYARKGPWRFLRDRVVRLALPAALVGFVLIPLTLHLLSPSPDGFIADYIGRYIGDWQVVFGHAWFLIHLLVYSALLVLVFKIRPSLAEPAGRHDVGNGAILAVLIAIAVGTYVVRVDYPVDTWVTLAGVLPAEPAHLPQYAILFGAGVLAGRRRLIERMPAGQGFAWLWLGLAAAAFPYLQHAVEVAGFALPRLTASGGAGWQAGLTAVWEAALAVGLSVGLPVLFRERLARPSPVSRAGSLIMTVYIVHVFVVVGFQTLLAEGRLPPLVLAIVVTVLATAVSFAIAAAWRSAATVAMAPRPPRPSQP